jgi:hypothetical protein
MSAFAVNGKEPVSVWCPSRDDAGNGTTTLTDLVGSKNGTLTNMDPATDWVSDTNAGGIRALDFDSVDDSVRTSATTLFSTSQLSLSAWVFRRDNRITSLIGQWGGTSAFVWVVNVGRFSPGDFGVFTNILSGEFPNVFTSGNVIPLNTWTHLALSYNGSLTALDRVQLWVNGVSQSLIFNQASSGSFPDTLPNISVPLWIGAQQNALDRSINGRMDDVRIWNNASLVAADVAELWFGGFGRARIIGNIQSRRRRFQYGGSGL